MTAGALAANYPFLGGEGELAERIASFDWSATSLGPIDAWPQSVKSAISLILRSHVPLVTLWGEAGLMIYNDAYAEFAGDRHPALLGAEVRFGWGEISAFNDNVMRVGLAGGTLSYRDHELILNRSGRPESVWMNLDYSPLLDEEGKPAGVIAIVVETTEKVRAERWVQAQQDRVRSLFDQAPGFMAVVVGAEHRFLMANPGFARLVGDRPLLDRTVNEALPDAVAQGYLALLDRVFSSGEPFRATAAHYAVQADPSGPVENRHVDFVFQPIRDPDGQVVATFILGSDVSDRLAAQGQLREGEVRNRQILDSATDYAIVATDPAGRVTRWNAGAERILGWSEGEVLGQDASIFVSQEDRNAARPRQEQVTALQEGRARDEGWYLRKSGERFWANGEMTPLLDEAGGAVGFVKVLRDRTEEHRAQTALVGAMDQLRRAQEAGGIGLFSLDLATSVLAATPEFCRIYGLPATQSIPVREIEALVLPEDAKVVLDHEARLRGVAATDVEYRIRRADTGALRTIARRAEYERDEAGQPVRLVGVVQDVTERRAVQQALEVSEAQFRALAQAMPNQVWTAGSDGALRWCNEQTYAYTGATPQQVLGEGLASFIHPEDLEATLGRWTAAVETGAIYEAEHRIRRADGAYRWHLARALPLRDAEEAITLWVGANTDIEDHKQDEAAHVRDRDRLWSMSQDLMLVCDREGEITAVNPSATRLLGWSEKEMVGQRLPDFLHPDDAASTAAELDKLTDGHTTLAFENRYRTRDGGYRLLDWTAVPDGDRIHGVGRDVTEQRAIAQDQERIWTLSPVLKVVGTPEGRIAKVNPAWSAALGWPQAETLGRRLTSFLPEEEIAAGEVLLQRLADGEPISEEELVLQAKDGGRRRIAWTLVREAATLYAFGRDVTEQRLAEEALRQSQKMEAVGQLTGGIAHDFNNLLQGITGSLDLMQKRITQGRIAELDRFLTGAMTSANRASALTHRLLAFSRRQPLDPRPVRANPLIASMEDLLRRTLGERVELELVLAGGLWLTKCDPNQLESAILNLAINARDAMPEGGTLVIETCNAHLDAAYTARQRDVRAGQYVCICVTDTGAGMDAETAARAFEPFFTTKPLGQGTGLGLSMIYGFAQQSEGYAKIYSEVGQGTTVKLYLPRRRGGLEADDDLPQLAAAPTAEAGETVLVVEDEPVVRGLIAEVLHDLGYQAIEAADGPQGLEILQSRRRIDLLITDVGLPGLNGRQVADAGRARRPGLKVLFMTGYAENAALASGFLEPGMAMITKPFAMEVMATRIRQIIEDEPSA